MNLSELAAAHILQVYKGDNWTEVGFVDTLEDVSFNEATTHTRASRNTIAMLVYHVKFYNEVILQRLNGVFPQINDANGFDMPALKDEAEWQRLKNDTHNSFVTLADAAKNFPEERLNEATPNGGSTYYQTIHGIAEHAHYHLGQIVLLKNLIRK